MEEAKKKLSDFDWYFDPRTRELMEVAGRMATTAAVAATLLETVVASGDKERPWRTEMLDREARDLRAWSERLRDVLYGRTGR